MNINENSIGEFIEIVVVEYNVVINNSKLNNIIIIFFRHQHILIILIISIIFINKIIRSSTSKVDILIKLYRTFGNNIIVRNFVY